MSKALSLGDYKIDWSDRLGGGHFGAVYGVVKRPENEKGWMSYLCPYLYDWVFPVREGTLKSEYCIKVIHNLSYVRSEPEEQFANNKLFREEGLTSVELMRSGSLLSYFKTRVSGKTMEEIGVATDRFYNETDYIMRKKFIEFFSAAKNSRLNIFDFWTDNIMYDDQKERWEVVDGNLQKESKEKNLVNDRLKFLNLITDFVIDELKRVALDNKDYSVEDDKALMDRVKGIFTPKEIQETHIEKSKFLKEINEKKKQKNEEDLQKVAAQATIVFFGFCYILTHITLDNGHLKFEMVI